MATTVPTPIISPLNDFSFIVPLKDVDPTTGKVVALTTGTVTFFLAITDDPAAATPADAAFQGNATHVGKGNWLIQLDAAVMTVAKMEAAFAATPPFLMIQKPSGFFVNLPLIYQKKKKAVLIAAPS
jgi:hypothetical protein